MSRPVAFVKLLVRTVRSAIDDRVVGAAAQVAFFALLSIPPFLLVLAGSAGYLDVFGPDVGEGAREWVMRGLGGFLAPNTMNEFVRPSVDAIFAEGHGGLLSIGALVAVWSASRLVRVLIEALNTSYRVEEWRLGWKRRLMALGMTAAGIVVLVVLLPLIVAGPRLGETIDDAIGLGGTLGAVWPVLYWPGAAGVGVIVLTSLYHFGPNRRASWLGQLPGAALAAAMWLGAAGALRLYVVYAMNQREIGPLAAPVVLMLWIFASAISVLLGATFNAELERMRAGDGEGAAGE